MKKLSKKVSSKNKSKKRSKKKKLQPKKSTDILVNQKMLFHVRDELKHNVTNVHLEVKSLEKKMDARFNEVDARFNEVDARFDRMDARFDRMDARFNEVDAQFKEVHGSIQKVLAEIQRVSLLVEEQNTRNKHILDGHQNLHDRQDRFEKEIRTEIVDMKEMITLTKTSRNNQ